MTPYQRRFDRMVGLFALTALVVGILLVLRPFVSSVLWAIVLTYSTWPVFEAVRRVLRGNSTYAAATMTGLLTLVIILPVTVLGISLGDSVAPVVEAIRGWFEGGLPDPPPWLAQLPLIGKSVNAYWASLAHDSVKLAEEIRRLVEPFRSWLLSGGLRIGQGLAYLVLSVVLAFFFYRDGDAAAQAYTRALQRIAGSRAARLTAVAGGTIRSVVYGILGTALAQSILAAIGLWIAGVPGSLLWGMLTFFLSVVPVGPPLVWGGATAWLVYQGSIGWAVFMALWGFFVISGIDNIIKPYLISRGSRLPFILTLLGVLGGALAFGIIGVFLGPLLLALGYRLLQEWVSTEPGPADPAEAVPSNPRDS
jgi:predicted PurR-regulated permease PerM